MKPVPRDPTGRPEAASKFPGTEVSAGTLTPAPFGGTVHT